MKQFSLLLHKTMIAPMAFLFFCGTASAQVKLGNNPNTIKSASLLELEATDKGLVFPRVSLTGLSSAAPLATDLLEGTVVYNTNSSLPGGTGLYIWASGVWKAVTSPAGYTLPSLTNGSVIFSNGTTLAQNNSQFFWDNANNRLGIGTASPNYKMDVAGIASITNAGASLQLKGSGTGSHTFAEFYPNGNGSTRSAFLGYGNNGSTQFAIINEISNGDMTLSTGQDLYLNAGAKGKLMLQGSTGNLGVNTTGTAHPVTIQAAAGSSALLGFYNSSGTDKYNFSLTNGGLNLSESFVAGGRLFIKDGGNVGIGTTNPTQKLEVSGTIQISGAGNGVKFPDGTLQTTAATGGFTLPALTNGSVLFSNGTTIAQNNASFFWDNTNSRLGIGTASPNYKLDVAGTPSFKNDGASLQLKSTGNGKHTFMEIYPNGEGTARGAFIGYPSNNITTLALQNESVNGDIAMLTPHDINILAGVGNLTLQGSTGNIGIGTASPSQRLEVLGSVYANAENKGFLVDNGNTARVGLIKYAGHEGGIWRTSTQDFEIGRVDASVTSLPGLPSSYTTDLYVSGSGQIGVGTTSPSAVLDVNGSTRLRGLTTAGVVVTDANGNLSSSATYGLATANNGLNAVGNNVSLGGTLTQTTTINQGSNAFVLQGSGTSEVPGNVNFKPAGVGTGGYVTPATTNGQSFTLAQASLVKSIVIYNAGSTSSGTVTLSLFNGNGTTATYSQTVTVIPGFATYVLNTPQTLSAGVSRFEFTQGVTPARIFLGTGSGSYGGGAAYTNGAPTSIGQYDVYFEINYTVSQSSPTLYASSNGNVGIGTSSPQRKLQVFTDGFGITQTNGVVEMGTYTDNYFGWLGTLSNHPLAFYTNNSYEQMVLATNGNVGIGTSTPSYKLDVNGGIRCVGAVNTTSDARLKQNIRPVGNALQGILKLDGVRYTFRDKEFPSMDFPKGEQIGVLAQQVEKVYPELVSTDDKGYKAVNYAQLNAVLIEAIKEQQQLIETVKTKNDQLEKQNAAIKQDMEALKAQVKMLAEKITPATAVHQ